MTTTIPRIQTKLDAEDLEIVRRISHVEKRSESEVVARLVHAAIDMAEDMALAAIGAERLRTFDRSKALSMEEMRQWSKNLKKKTRRHVTA